MDDAERIAREFHTTYEALAPNFGYKTREASAVPWDEVPEQNRSLMISVCSSLLDLGIIAMPSGPTPTPYHEEMTHDAISAGHPVPDVGAWVPPDPDDLHVPVTQIVVVDRRWLVHVDSITSLVAHRGLDDESKLDLLDISRRARRMTAIPRGETLAHG